MGKIVMFILIIIPLIFIGVIGYETYNLITRNGFEEIENYFDEPQRVEKEVLIPDPFPVYLENECPIIEEVECEECDECADITMIREELEYWKDLSEKRKKEINSLEYTINQNYDCIFN